MKRKSLQELYGKEYYLSHHENPQMWAAVAIYLKRKFRPRRALDVGCARGFLVESLVHLGVDAYGVDVSEFAVSHCPSNVRGRLFRVDLNLENIPFDDRHFDLIVSFHTLEHLENLDHVMIEMKRVLSRDGTIYVVTPDKELRSEYHPNSHEYEFWRRFFEKHGLKTNRMSNRSWGMPTARNPIGFLPDFLSLPCRMLAYQLMRLWKPIKNEARFIAKFSAMTLESPDRSSYLCFLFVQCLGGNWYLLSRC